MIFGKDEQYALCADEGKVLFASMSNIDGRTNRIQLLATSLLVEGNTINGSSLVSGSGQKKGKVALILPLSFFDVRSVSVPAVSREAVARMLPFNLSKVLSAPVSDFIYDWQVAQKFKDRHELSVYLYPVIEYNRLRQELLSRKKEICWFEPDVFSACGFLESIDHESLMDTTLVILAWENTISFAVYENKKIALVRSVELMRPTGTPEEEKKRLEEDERSRQNEQEHESVPEVLLDEEDDVEVKQEPFDFAGSSSIIDGFNLQQGVEIDQEEALEELDQSPDEEEDKKEMKWADYLQNLSLEILRTADYHTSVLKGRAVKNIMIGGAEFFYSEFSSSIQETQRIEIFSFPPEQIDCDCEQTMAALCVGALDR